MEWNSAGKVTCKWYGFALEYERLLQERLPRKENERCRLGMDELKGLLGIKKID